MREADVPWVVEVSLAADGMFADAGIVLPPDDPRELLDHVLGPVRADGTRRAPERFGAVLVAEASGADGHEGRVAGLAALIELDGAAHLEQIAVHPGLGRRGIGRALLEAACERARDAGFGALTLTTFRDLAWNAPWYARRGFSELPRQAWGPDLAAQWRTEEEAGILVAPRIAMRRPLERR
ncbi:GNAT family N-acetyltransferase [Nocardiopsis sp. RSe5-2]|uniref:GNAT family N-acetyltransferase n=1 Tax=Nocardiopsis endophytica TaxID=3018445 RepID=A0ABT4UEZ8_9ACTN|nr:GNAT family N-acetyltransferase [Nocardiopsis endophytica]MDA2815059.1 GNAT family N-acetyltransferase [Nocardiopsis endophytica]